MIDKDVKLTILIPCYNEEETVGECIINAQRFLNDNKINGEVLVINNNSSDKSKEIAVSKGARVIDELNRGYGAALMCGNKNAYGKYIIMLDADLSYDIFSCTEFIKKLDLGYDLVVGNRFKGKIEKGAMSFSHKYIGNPILSFIGKRMFKIKIGDFHCGLRAYQKDKILSLNLKTPGMEYATEMIVRASLNNLKIAEIPITLHKDHRINTKSKLNTFSDGIRHLKLMLKMRKEYRSEKE